MRIGDVRAPDCTINEVLWRNVEVDVLRAAGLVGPGPAKRRVEVVGRVEIQAESGQVLAQRQRHQVRVGLGRPYERQQADDAKLVVDHAGRYVRHPPVRVRLDALRKRTTHLRVAVLLVNAMVIGEILKKLVWFRYFRTMQFER